MPTTSPAITELHGRWLLLARLAWLAVCLVTLTLFIVSVPANYLDLRSVGGSSGASIWSLSPEETRALGQLGMSVGDYAAFFVTVELIFVVSVQMVSREWGQSPMLAIDSGRELV